jgi:integrase
MDSPNSHAGHPAPWNKGKFTGRKPPLKLSEIRAIRTRLQIASNVRELAMFNLAIDSKLRACDLTRLRVQDICHETRVGSRATVMQQKKQRPVQFEITERTRQSVEAWIAKRGLRSADYLFPSRVHTSAHLSTRQYARLVHRWGSVHRTGRHCVRYSHHAAHESFADLPPHQRPSRGSTATGAQQAGKHCPLSPHRGRRCTRDG